MLQASACLFDAWRCARVAAASATQVAEIEAAEKDKMRSKVRSIIDHGINCFINRQLIYNLPEEMFADAGGWMGVGQEPGWVQLEACRLSGFRSHPPI